MPFTPFDASAEIKKQYQENTAFKQAWDNMLKEEQKKKKPEHCTTSQPMRLDKDGPVINDLLVFKEE